MKKIVLLALTALMMVGCMETKEGGEPIIRSEEMQYRHDGDMPFQCYSGIGIPCWSLAALLDQLEDRISDEEYNQWELVLKKEDVQYDIYYLNIWGEQDNIGLDHFYDDLIDCCYEMILKLKERDLL